MPIPFRIPLAAHVPLMVLLGAGAVGAETLALAPRHAVGDAYALDLEARTVTEARSRSAEDRASTEDLRLRYRADVLVLATDERGRAVREGHRNVAMTAQDADGSRSLLGEGAAFEVRRIDGGAVEVHGANGRLDEPLERVILAVLDHRFDHGLGPSLLDPGRPVAPGETWELDRDLARRFLRASGVRAFSFAEAPTATLREDAQPEGRPAIDYRIPVSWLELTEMPPDTRPAETEATFEGRLLLASQPGAAHSHRAALRLRMNGVVRKPGVSRPVPWHLRSETSARERILPRPRGAPVPTAKLRLDPPLPSVH